jgi:hypothetical protein
MLVIEKNDGKVKWVKDGVVQGTALDLNVQNDSGARRPRDRRRPRLREQPPRLPLLLLDLAAADSSTSTKWADNRVERYD